MDAEIADGLDSVSRFPDKISAPLECERFHRFRLDATIATLRSDNGEIGIRPHALVYPDQEHFLLIEFDHYYT